MHGRNLLPSCVALSSLGVALATREIWFAGTPSAGFSLPPADDLSGSGGVLWRGLARIWSREFGNRAAHCGIGGNRQPARRRPSRDRRHAPHGRGRCGGSGRDHSARSPGRGKQWCWSPCSLGLHRRRHISGAVRRGTMATSARGRTAAVGARRSARSYEWGLATAPWPVCPRGAHRRFGSRHVSPPSCSWFRQPRFSGPHSRAAGLPSSPEWQ